MAYSILLLIFAALPLVSSAQTPGIQEYIPAFIEFFNTTLIPFLFGIAFLIFVVNVVRYFIVGAANENDRGNARMLALYTVVAFVTLILFWGVVNLIAVSTGLGGCSPIQSDYAPGGTEESTDCYTAPSPGNNNPPGAGGSTPGPTTPHSGVGNSGGSGGANVPPPSTTGGNNVNPAPNPTSNPFPTGGSIAPEEPSSIYCYLPNGTAIETTRAQCRLQGGTYND